MNEQKEERVMRLFCAIGEVDESYLSSIMQAERPKKRSFALFLRTAAALFLCVSVILVGVRLTGISSETDAPSDDALSVEALLLSNISVMTRVDAASIDLFGGVPMLICSFAGGEDLYTYALDEGMLGVNLGSGANLTPEQADRVDFRLWFCDGDGGVVSPQLKASSGNYAKGYLVQFTPEVEPSGDVYAYLASKLQ